MSSFLSGIWSFVDRGWSGYGIVVDILLPVWFLLLLGSALNARGLISGLTGMPPKTIPKWLVWVTRVRYSFASFAVLILYLIFRSENYGGALGLLTVGPLTSFYYYYYKYGFNGDKPVPLCLLSRIEVQYLIATLVYGLPVLISIILRAPVSQPLNFILYDIVPLLLLPIIIVYILWLMFLRWKRRRA